MTGLSITRVGDARTAEAWTRVHNEVIPTAPLTLDQVVARSRINVLEVAHRGDALVGCSTVRPATDEDPVTVIVRVLPAYRRQGLGSAYLAHTMEHARGMGATTVQTVVLESNTDGLAFALRRGFVETERYTLDGETVAYVHLARPLEDATAQGRDTT